MKLSFTALGGGNEIGANSYLLKFDDRSIILDCGLHPKKKLLEAFPDYDLLQDAPSHLIITHAHLDHIGALPYFLKYFPSAKIHITKPTLSIAEVMLMNTSNIINRDFEFEYDKRAIEYYSEEVVNLIPYLLKQYEFNKNINLESDLSIKFIEAGHILGAAMVEINCKGKRILYTGDFSFRDQSLLPAAKNVKDKIDILITECTNGTNETLPDYKNEIKRLTKFINDITNKGGTVLIPVFAIGKAQEMQKRIFDLMEHNKIPHLPVYYSPLSSAIDDVYDHHNYNVSRMKKGLKLEHYEKRILTKRNLHRSKFFKEPSILLLTSGMMMEHTTSYIVAKEFLRRKEFGIAVCGYCDPETPGYLVKNAKKYDVLLFRDEEKGIPVNCRIENYNFSSHAKREHILELIENTKPENVLLVHGDQNAISEMGRLILEKFPGIKLFSPEKGKEVEL
jgi:cleavage and polyadenylation specificity factor subunit 3